MVETRFSKFLQKLSFSGAGRQYEPLERGELETLVSLGDRTRAMRPDPRPSCTPPQPKTPFAACGLPSSNPPSSPRF